MTVDSIRAEIPGVEHFVALEGARPGWLDYETTGCRLRLRVRQARHRRKRSAYHQLHQRHHVPPQGRHDHPSQRVYECGWHSRSFPYDARRPLSLDAAHVSRQRHGPSSGSSRPWAVRTSACANSIRKLAFDQIDQESVSVLCAAPTVLICLANAPEDIAAQSSSWSSRAHRRSASGCSYDPARRRRVRLGRNPGLRHDRDLSVYFDMRTPSSSTRRHRPNSALRSRLVRESN